MVGGGRKEKKTKKTSKRSKTRPVKAKKKLKVKFLKKVITNYKTKKQCSTKLASKKTILQKMISTQNIEIKKGKVTVKDLKDSIKKFKKIHCPGLSKMKKLELLTFVNVHNIPILEVDSPEEIFVKKAHKKALELHNTLHKIPKKKKKKVTNTISKKKSEKKSKKKLPKKKLAKKKLKILIRTPTPRTPTPPSPSPDVDDIIYDIKQEFDKKRKKNINQIIEFTSTYFNNIKDYYSSWSALTDDIIDSLEENPVSKAKLKEYLKELEKFENY